VAPAVVANPKQGAAKSTSREPHFEGCPIGNRRLGAIALFRLGKVWLDEMAAVPTARPLLGRPINLQASGPQPWYPVKVEVALPSEEFIDRDLVAIAYLLDWSPATTNRLHDGGFAADGPSRWRLR
jgi:hypothetical protein